MRVLLMEDERRMAALLKRGLDRGRSPGSFGHDGMEGLEIARAGEFDVLVLDFMLPGIDGLTIARRLREENNQTPVIMLTARDTAADVVAALDAGAYYDITKPFPFELFVALTTPSANARNSASPSKVRDIKLVSGCAQGSCHSLSVANPAGTRPGGIRIAHVGGAFDGKPGLLRGSRRRKRDNEDDWQ